MCDLDAAREPDAANGLADRSWRRVVTTLRRLEAEHGEFDVLRDTWTVDADRYERTHERFEAGTVGGAGAWVRNGSGEVLLVRESGERGWSEPAGKHEPNESLADTARREVVEETNVECTLTGVALAQVIRMEHPDRPTLYRLIVTFSAEYADGTPCPQRGAIDEVRWWASPPPRFQYEALERLPIPVSLDDE